MRKAFGTKPCCSTRFHRDPLAGEEGVDPGLAPLPVEDQEHPAGQGHDRTGIGAEHRLRVLLVMPRLPLDNAFRMALPDNDVVGRVLRGLLQDEVVLQPREPGAAAVLPGVGHAGFR